MTTKQKPEYVRIEERAFKFIVAECTKIHHILDLMEVPREHEDGSKLSMCQRVEFYVGAMEVIYREWLVLKGEEGEEEVPPPDTAH